MMKIKMLFFAQLREAAGVSEQIINLAQPVAIGEFVKSFLEQPRFAACKDLPVRYAVNDEFVDVEEIVGDRAVIAIIPPVAGG